MHNPLNLTFGVEIECIVLFDPTKYEEAIPYAEGTLWDKNISAHLHRESKLRIICRSFMVNILRTAGFRTYNVTSSGGDQKWTVANDASIQIVDGPRTDGLLECDVEIKSPALRFCPKALRRIKRVVKLLTTEFDVFVNGSCGFHVHIGNWKSGFPLQTLKHVCMLTAMFEHQLNSLHPAHRIGNEHAKAPSAVFRGQNPWDTVATIQGCRARARLVRLYAGSERRPDRCFAYNLLPLVSGPHKTIEFRQHKGTLDWSEMANWVQLAGGVVKAMHEISADGLAQLISTCAFDRKFTVFDLFLRLKLEALIPFYRGERHVHLRPEPLWVPGKIEGNAGAGPRRRPGYERWDELEKRHRVERLQELKRLEELDRRHELERERELERQLEEADAARGAF